MSVLPGVARMTATVRTVPAIWVDLAAMFEARCWARARLVREGELHLHDAIDKLQSDAERDGLVAALGQDRVPEMMGAAFAMVGMLTAWDLGEAYADHRGVLDAVTLAELDALIEQNDPQQFRNWIAWLTVAERAAVRDLMVAA
jgi:hypothetical protein